MFELGIKIFIAYLLGSISGSLVLGRFKGTDIRTLGSGNAGATNALRTQGLMFAIGVALIDVGKGLLAAAWVSQIDWFGADPEIRRIWIVAGCGMAAVFGHIYPFWHQFRGGKGAATLIGAYCIVAPKVIIPTLIVFVVVLILFGYVGLSTMVAVICALGFVLLLYPSEATIAWFAAFSALLVVFAHRSNIQRMINKQESQVDRGSLFFWRK